MLEQLRIKARSVGYRLAVKLLAYCGGEITLHMASRCAFCGATDDQGVNVLEFLRRLESGEELSQEALSVECYKGVGGMVN